MTLPRCSKSNIFSRILNYISRVSYTYYKNAIFSFLIAGENVMSAISTPKAYNRTFVFLFVYCMLRPKRKDVDFFMGISAYDFTDCNYSHWHSSRKNLRTKFQIIPCLYSTQALLLFLYNETSFRAVINRNLQHHDLGEKTFFRRLIRCHEQHTKLENYRQKRRIKLNDGTEAMRKEETKCIGCPREKRNRGGRGEWSFARYGLGVRVWQQ